MREDLLKELEAEYEQIRSDNERTEMERKERIRRDYPEIHALVTEREEMIYGSIRNIFRGGVKADDLPARMEEVSSKIRTMLEEKGLPADYLSPVCRCSLCGDLGRTGDPVREPCVCMKRAYRKKLRERIGLNSEQDETFERFNPDLFSDETLPGRHYSQRELMNLCRKTCEDWADAYPDTPWKDILLTGKSGLGKTFLLRSMAERLIERDIDVLIISAFQLVELSRKAYFTGEGSAEELMSAEVLMIDDLGSEPMMQNVTVEQLFNLLNERRNRGLSTVISTNLDMNDFRNRYTERIASRLRDRSICKVIPLEGNDVRPGKGRTE